MFNYSKKNEVTFTPALEETVEELPESLIINGVTYTVEYRKMDGYFGMTEYSAQLITIDNSVSLERQKKTLVHEIAHAVLYESGRQHHNNEELVREIEALVYPLLKQNDFSWARG